MLKMTAKDWGLFYFSYKGKLKRQGFFLGYLSLLVFYYIALKFIKPVGDGGEANLRFGAQNLIFFSCFSYMAFALSVKRLRDLNRSGWFCLLYFVPALNFLFWLYLLFKKSAPSAGDGNSFSSRFNDVA